MYVVILNLNSGPTTLNPARSYATLLSTSSVGALGDMVGTQRGLEFRTKVKVLGFRVKVLGFRA